MPKLRRKLVGLVLTLMTWVVLLWFAFPFLWLISTSLKATRQAFAIPPAWIFRPTLQNYIAVLRNPEFVRALRNSLAIASMTTGLSMLLGVPASYCFNRFRFTGKSALTIYVFMSRIAPPVGVAIPYFVIFSRLKLLDTHIAITLVVMTYTLAFAMWMMRGFFDSVPVELEEAGMIDGCGRFEAMFRIVFPLVSPGLAAVAIFIFIMTWNEFFYALLFTQVKARTAPVHIIAYMAAEGIRWGELTATGTLIFLPVLILALSVQRYLVSGLTMGAIKQ